MHFKLVVVAMFAAYFVPAFAQVEIINCSTHTEIKRAYRAVFGELEESAINQQGTRMLKYAEHVINNIAKRNSGDDETTVQDPKEVPLGALVSNTEDGLAVLALMRMLKTNGYTNIKIVAVLNSSDERGLKIDKFIGKIKEFGNKNVFWFHTINGIPMDDGYDSLTSGQVVENMKDVEFLADGLCSGEYRAKNANMTLVDAFKILKGLSPADMSKSVFVMSYVAPSGRSEEGKWKNDFHCSAVVTTTYPLPALRGDSILNVLAHPKIDGDNDIKAAFLRALANNPDYEVDIAAIKGELKKPAYPGWMELKSKK